MSTSTETSLLFRDYQMGPLHLKNRIVMAPLTRARSSRAGVPPEFAVDYYQQRTGAGLIISEATNISPQAIGYAVYPWYLEFAAGGELEAGDAGGA